MSDVVADDDDEAPEIYACLWAEGEFDPGLLDELFGVQARTHRRGELRRNGRPYETDSWHYSTARETSWDWPGHLEQVLGLVRPHREAFLALRQHHGFENGVHVVATATVSTPVGTVSEQAIQELASLRCSLDMDLYCAWEPREHE